jgi:hypothetical protein
MAQPGDYFNGLLCGVIGEKAFGERGKEKGTSLISVMGLSPFMTNNQ